MFNRDNLIKIVCIIAISEVIYRFSKRIYKKFKRNNMANGLTYSLIQAYQPENHTNEFHKVLFFPDPGIPCKREQIGRVCKAINCPYKHGETSFSVFLKILNLTQKTLDVCTYIFTCSMLGDALIECNKRGVIVRVIIEEENSGESCQVAGAQIGRLRAAGILVRTHSSLFWMHHKFLIADGEILVNGSFNWTNHAILGNFENLIITSAEKIVQPFINEFDKLWDHLDPKEYRENSTHSSRDIL